MKSKALLKYPKIIKAPKVMLLIQRRSLCSLCLCGKNVLNTLTTDTNYY